MKRKYTAGILLVLLTLFLSSCLTSDNPLGKSSDAVTDPLLAGIWYMQDEQMPGKESYMAVSPDGDGYFRFITFDNAGSEPAQYLGYVTAISGDTYLNLRPVKYTEGRAEAQDRYMFMSYRIYDTDTLFLAAFNEDHFREAVEKGELRGTVSESPGKDVNLTDITENLVKFIEDDDKGRYLDDGITMIRLR